jgi:hypothetical protein
MTTTTDHFDDAMTACGHLVREAERLDETQLTDEQLARWVWTIRGLIKRLRVVDGEASYVFSGRLVRNHPTLLEGVEWTALTKSTRTEWDNDAVTRKMVTACRFDPATGEERSPAAALDVMAQLYALGGTNGGLRLKAAKELVPDFDPDEYCHTERSSNVKAVEAGADKAAD